MAAALRSSSAADVRRALRISHAALSTLPSASRPPTVASFSRSVPAISGANNSYSWSFRRFLSSKKKRRLLGSNKLPAVSASNTEAFLQDLRDLELLGSHKIHLPLPAISDPEIETALKDLMAASWNELPHSLVEEAKKAVSKATDDVAGQEALKNVFRAAEACKEFGGVLVTLREALDRYCGLTGIIRGPLPGYVEDAVRSTSDRYMTYLKSFRPDEIYLARKVETELRKKVIHLRMRCSFIRREGLMVCLSRILLVPPVWFVSTPASVVELVFNTSMVFSALVCAIMGHLLVSFKKLLRTKLLVHNSNPILLKNFGGSSLGNFFYSHETV